MPSSTATQRASLISVIIPCYKQAHYLGEAIESVLTQTYTHFEIIVVDDGSPDNTAEVAASYPGVRYIRQNNQGVCAARNTGLGKSKGEYIVFLDADDRLLSEALASGLECLAKHPECAFVAGQYRFITSDGGPLQTLPKSYGQESNYLTLLHDNFITMHAAVMYRRSVFEAVGDFNRLVPGTEDYDLYLRIAQRFPFYCYNKMVGEYRRHGTNTSGNPAYMLKSVTRTLRSQRNFVKGDKRYEEAYRIGLKVNRDYYGDLLVERVLSRVRARREGKEALRDLALLLRYHPQGFVRHAYGKLSNITFKNKR